MMTGRRMFTREHGGLYLPWCRVIQRTVRRDKPTAHWYTIDLDLAPTMPVPCAPYNTPAGFYPPLGTGNTPADGVTYYMKPGSGGGAPNGGPPGTAPGHSKDWYFASYDVADSRTPAGFSDEAGNGVENNVQLWICGYGQLDLYLLASQLDYNSCFSIEQQDWEYRGSILGWAQLADVTLVPLSGDSPCGTSGAPTTLQIGDLTSTPACFRLIIVWVQHKCGVAENGGKLAYGGAQWTPS